jgi:hypothetical protein
VTGSNLTGDVRRRPLGRLLVEMGALDSSQLELVLAIQRRDGRRLGEIVVERGLVSSLALAAALARQKKDARPNHVLRETKPPGWRPLGTLLVEANCISEVQLQQALADQQEEGGYLGDLLVERGWITPGELVQALDSQLRPPETGAPAFTIRELVGGHFRTLEVTTSFVTASDYVFEEVLPDREPERLEILRGEEPWQEVVWSFEREEPKNTSAAELLEAFHAFTSRLATS